MAYMDVYKAPTVQVQTVDVKAADNIMMYEEVEAVLTAYSSHENGLTASGARVSRGVIAAPANLPYGTQIQFSYDGQTYVVKDRGTAIVIDEQGRYHIDVWVPSYKESCNFGRKECKVRIFRKWR